MKKLTEYQHMEDNYSHYVSRPVAVPVPDIIKNLLRKTQVGADSSVDLQSYRSIRIDNINGDVSNFDLKLIDKASLSDRWFFLPSNYGAIIYNDDWLIACRIDESLMKNKIGNYDFYFQHQLSFRDSSIYYLLTWQPDTGRILWLNAVTVIALYLLHLAIWGGVILSVLQICKNRYRYEYCCYAGGDIDPIFLKSGGKKAFLVLRGTDFTCFFLK
ncbi:MAG: hypothetical protein WC453_04490 [Patescibacteria group bacterium]